MQWQRLLNFSDFFVKNIRVTTKYSKFKNKHKMLTYYPFHQVRKLVKFKMSAFKKLKALKKQK